MISELESKVDVFESQLGILNELLRAKEDDIQALNKCEYESNLRLKEE